MHILLVTHHYAPEVGAPQRRWGALVPRFLAAGHEVTVLTPPPHYPAGAVHKLVPGLRTGDTALGEHGETVHRVRFREHGHGIRSRTLDQTIAATDSVVRGVRELGRRGRRPDVVVATVPGIPSIAAGVALRHALRVPLVVEMRDAWPDLIEPSGMMGETRRRRGWKGAVTAEIHRVMTLLQKDAAAVVTTTDAFGEVLRERGMKRVEVIRNGAYLDEIPLLGARPSPTTDPLRVLYLGTVGRAQGLGTAVAAAGLLRERGRPVELRIVGPGFEYAHLAEVSADRGVPVDLRGPVARSEVFDHYAWADSLLVSLRSWLPLRWTVPSKLYEMMATGRHVTAVMAGEAADIVEATGAGHVVHPEDPEALAALWRRLDEDRELLDVDGRARAWARQHSDYTRLAADYLAVLEGVVR
ncbi:glycosyltransferase family 4 protein [Cellulomonas carbonis]|uniref:D-inositol 3-phosphate glycosyltransferase n=1 Tax=Cellulomonas carbonis T26 TaxID=947969 RepID=A0A0A0BRZ2_9CELL|nr:glycosyltransferase family 4 protein [Cellulomonas carbonis]KGM11213.1 glycosyl transferase family 1 [Cellulomonas carbonis T26]GGC10773.1 glycosyltransferase WbuB [Cellulomonas carbonis]